MEEALENDKESSHSAHASGMNIQGVTGGMCETSGECSLGQTIPI